jgi:hypothetical protein
VAQNLLLLVEWERSYRVEDGLFNRHLDVPPIIANPVDKFDGRWRSLVRAKIGAGYRASNLSGCYQPPNGTSFSLGTDAKNGSAIPAAAADALTSACFLPCEIKRAVPFSDWFDLAGNYHQLERPLLGHLAATQPQLEVEKFRTRASALSSRYQGDPVASRRAQKRREGRTNPGWRVDSINNFGGGRGESST